MPDPTDKTDKTAVDPSSYGAILASMSDPGDPDESKVESTEQVLPTDDEPNSELKDTDEESDKEEGDDEYDGPELDAIMLDPDSTPEQRNEAWRNHWKGIQKMRDQVEEREQRVAAVEQEIQRLGSSDIEEVRAEIQSSLEKIADRHGVTWEELLGITTKHSLPNANSQKGYGEGSTEEYGTYDGIPYASAAERVLLEERSARAEAEARINKKLQEFELREQAAKQQAELNQFMESVASRVTRKAKETLQGFEVTKEMIREAVHGDPKLKTHLDVLDAVKRRNVDAILAHITKVTRESSKKGPELIPNSGGRGQERKAPADAGYGDFLAEFRKL